MTRTENHITENGCHTQEATSERRASVPASFFGLEMAETVAPVKPKRPPRPRGRKNLTTSQKSEAAALWRTGSVTLVDLAKRFDKRPETFSKLFTRMGIKKGEAAEEHAKKTAAVIEARLIGDAEEHARRIAQAKEEHYKMSSGLAKLAWAEIVRARQADLKIDGLKDTMQTLRLASEVIANARKELWQVLGIEEADKKKDFEDLPELTVRELTGSEISQLQGQTEIDELSGDGDVGADMLPDEESP